MARACVGGPCWPVQPEDRGDRNGRVQGLVQNHAHPVSADPVYTTLPDSGKLLRLTSDSYDKLFTSDTTAYKRNGQDRTGPNISGQPGCKVLNNIFGGAAGNFALHGRSPSQSSSFFWTAHLLGLKKIYLLHACTPS
jgi:hypothetical protein